MLIFALDATMLDGEPLYKTGNFVIFNFSDISNNTGISSDSNINVSPSYMASNFCITS